MVILVVGYKIKLKNSLSLLISLLLFLSGFDSELVTTLFTVFQIPSRVFGLAGSPIFSLAITGLWGFSNGPFEEITLFSLS